MTISNHTTPLPVTRLLASFEDEPTVPLQFSWRWRPTECCPLSRSHSLGGLGLQNLRVQDWYATHLWVCHLHKLTVEVQKGWPGQGYLGHTGESEFQAAHSAGLSNTCSVQQHLALALPASALCSNSIPETLIVRHCIARRPRWQMSVERAC